MRGKLGSKKASGSRKAGHSSHTDGAKSRGRQHASSVYEYNPQGKHKRAHVGLDLSRDEVRDAAVSEDEDEDDMKAMKARLVKMVQEDTIEIGSDEDEDIESDNAFDESEEERFAEFFSRKTSGQSKTRSGKSADAESPSQSEDSSGEEGDYYDALDILDGRAAMDTTVPSTSSREQGTSTQVAESMSSKKPSLLGLSYDKAEGSSTTSSDERDLSDGAEDDDEALENLEKIISGLDQGTSKRKTREQDQEFTQPPKRKKKLIHDATEAGPEGQFLTRNSSNRLALDDLLRPLGTTSQPLIQATKVIKEDGSGRSRALPTPLPLRAKDRLDRDAAYEETKQATQKWQATMKRIKEAEHLSFPLQAPEVQKPSNAELVAKFKPSTTLESAVDRLLRAGGVKDDEIAQSEALEMTNLTPDEVQKRRLELRQLRELAFRADRKAKRVAKIKSKLYRKIHRKAKERQEAEADEAETQDSADEQEDLHRREVERARERATLRHKNTGKWAKAQRRKSTQDISQRQAISEQLTEGERLRRRIAGEDSESNSESDDNDDDVPEMIKRVENAEDVQLPGHSSKGLFSMKFMQEAEAREQNEIRRDIQDMRQEVTGEDTEVEDQGQSHRARKQVFLPTDVAKAQIHQSEDLPGNEPNGEISRSRSSEDDEMPDHLDVEPDSQPEQNPWLSREISIKKPSKATAAQTGPAERSKHLTKKHVSKQPANKRKRNEDDVLEIVPNQFLKLPSGAGPERDTEDEADGDDSEVENEDRKTEAKLRKKKLSQRELVTLAFAGEDVVQEFDAVKSKESQPIVTQEETGLPGWGSWTGPGSKGQSRPLAKPSNENQGTREISKRADFNKSHIIISEKRDKKAAKYQAKDVPYPYTSKAQYERSLSTPLGAEWNTRTGFQRGTLPRVVKKMGALIEPLVAPQEAA